MVFVDSFVSLRFNVPRYGSNPSFSVICFFTHGSFRNRVPPPCPVKTLPFSVTGCKCCAFSICRKRDRTRRNLVGLVVYGCFLSHSATFWKSGLVLMFRTGTCIFSLVSISGLNSGMIA